MINLLQQSVQFTTLRYNNCNEGFNVFANSLLEFVLDSNFDGPIFSLCQLQYWSSDIPYGHAKHILSITSKLTLATTTVTLVIFKISNGFALNQYLPLQKLDYSAYSTSLYGNDRVPLQYSGYYPVPGYHASPTSFNISNLNFVGKFLSISKAVHINCCTTILKQSKKFNFFA